MCGGRIFRLATTLFIQEILFLSCGWCDPRGKKSFKFVYHVNDFCNVLLDIVKTLCVAFRSHHACKHHFFFDPMFPLLFSFALCVLCCVRMCAGKTKM